MGRQQCPAGRAEMALPVTPGQRLGIVMIRIAPVYDGRENAPSSAEMIDQQYSRPAIQVHIRGPGAHDTEAEQLLAAMK